MAAQAWPAQGASLTAASTSIGQILSISHAGGGEVGERDTTVLSNTVRTNAPTIPDNGEMTFEFNYDPTDTGHQTLRGYKDTPAVVTWVVTFNSTPSHTASFSGWVKDFDGPNAEDVDSNLTASVTVRVTGAVTWA